MSDIWSSLVDLIAACNQLEHVIMRVVILFSGCCRIDIQYTSRFTLV